MSPDVLDVRGFVDGQATMLQECLPTLALKTFKPRGMVAMKKVALILISALMVLFLSGTGVFADDPDAPAPVETTGTVKGGGDNPAPDTKAE